jgi:hypothetical protein
MSVDTYRRKIKPKRKINIKRQPKGRRRSGDYSRIQNV